MRYIDIHYQCMPQTSCANIVYRIMLTTDTFVAAIDNKQNCSLIEYI